ncbi:MAG: 3-methyl-2-oxobutanoate dehydrogenase subunit VorB [bacterium]|nr:3-methyl-2-oxobutanoate dehydrogenase subunit VorB [bacterium]
MTTKRLMKGNEALGEGAIQAGCGAYFGYPITPQNELTEYMSRRMLEENRVFIQSESELAAINMVFGASVAGARAMTSSSSPGVSLKQEGLSYMAGCELPGLVVNVQRGGPGLGNISGSQADYFQAVKGGGHGDYHLIVLTPGSVQELYEMPALAFSLSEKYRTPAMILTDGILAQMQEPMEAVKIDTTRDENRDWILDGCKGRAPRKIRSLLMEEGALEAHNRHLQDKYNLIKTQEQRYQLINEQAEIMLVAYGISARVCYTAIQEANKKGAKLGLLRPLTVWPFPEKILQELALKVKAFLVVELNAGQMVEDVKLAVNGKTPVHFYGRAGGACVTPGEILKEIEKI